MTAEQERHTALRLHPCRLLLPCSCPGITANCELCRSAYGPIWNQTMTLKLNNKQAKKHTHTHKEGGEKRPQLPFSLVETVDNGQIDKKKMGQMHKGDRKSHRVGVPSEEHLLTVNAWLVPKQRYQAVAAFPWETRCQDLTSDMDLRPQHCSFPDQLVSD